MGGGFAGGGSSAPCRSALNAQKLPFACNGYRSQGHKVPAKIALLQPTVVFLLTQPKRLGICNSVMSAIQISHVQKEFCRWVAYGFAGADEVYCSFPERPSQAEIEQAIKNGYFQFV